MEGDLLESDLTAARVRHWRRLARTLHAGLTNEQFHEPLGRAGGTLQIADDFRNRTDGACDEHRVENKCREITRRDTTCQNVMSADPKDHANRSEHEEHHQRHEPRAILPDHMRQQHLRIERNETRLREGAGNRRGQHGKPAS